MRVFRISIFLLLALAASLQAAFVAVLETGADLLIKDKVSLADRQYLTNVLREQAVKELPATENYTIMTRENITAMLPPGKSIEDCEGSCLAETGKNIAADYVCQARVSSFNGSLTLSAELYETAGNKLIASFNGLGPNLNALLQLIIQKSPEFFHSVKSNSNIAPAKPTWVPPTEQPSMPKVAVQNTAAPKTRYEKSTLQSPKAENARWPRAGFFLHAGVINAGLGVKIRFSHENGIYMTADVRWVSFQEHDFVHVPFMIYLGGNHVHFITGITVRGRNDDENQDVQVPIGLNCDIGRHFGIDVLYFLPSSDSRKDKALMLDFRFVI